MSGNFDILYESLMGKIRKWTGMGGFDGLKKEWEKLKQEALKIIGARVNDWKHVHTPKRQPLNYLVGGNSSLNFGPEKLQRLLEIKERLDAIKVEVEALGIRWYEIDDTL